eukprot:1325337-Pyramimonas_sp.AAC.1
MSGGHVGNKTKPKRPLLPLRWMPRCFEALDAEKEVLLTAKQKERTRLGVPNPGKRSKRCRRLKVTDKNERPECDRVRVLVRVRFALLEGVSCRRPAPICDGCDGFATRRVCAWVCVTGGPGAVL